ncbi:hypothetical protein [Paenibacillus sp. SSG-1]|nr:hypothetical protein [Paenibacillus sp. SSG-1]
MAIVSNRKRRFVGKFIGNDVYLLDEWVKEMTRVEKTGENRGFTRVKKNF